MFPRLAHAGRCGIGQRYGAGYFRTLSERSKRHKIFTSLFVRLRFKKALEKLLNFPAKAEPTVFPYFDSRPEQKATIRKNG